MRLEIIDSDHGFKIINDCYNANPDSMKNAITELCEYKGDFNRIAVLGDMLELGEDAEKEHLSLGKLIASEQIDYLFTYGELGELILEGTEGQVRGGSFDSHEQIGRRIISAAKKGDIVLVKGSRGMKMENVIKYLGGQRKG